MPTAVAPTPPRPVALMLGTAICLLGLALGWPLAAAPITMAACAAILAIGLPHGTLDLDLFRQAEPGAARSVILLLYLAFAGTMAGAWVASPVVALALFFALATVHFAEDWARTGSTFLAQGMALALLSLPALTHTAEMTTLLAPLAGTESGAVFVDLLMLVAPVAAMVAVVALALLWTVGARAEAIAGGVSLSAMALLPPMVGFALFFCLFHSPLHLREGLAALAARTVLYRAVTVAGLTLAAAAIVGIVYALGTALSGADRLVAACFQTLSILTLPHMAVPMVLRVLRRAASARRADDARQMRSSGPRRRAA